MYSGSVGRADTDTQGSGGLTVAVTGPTGEIGRPFIRALEKTRGVSEIRGMARRPFDPAANGWKKTTYVQGDILDRESVERLVDGADVVVHLAFIIMGGGAQTRAINLDGSRNVFRAAVDAGADRLVYTSSVAAYGFHPDNPQPLTEDVAPRGTDGFYYSAQKAELESVLAEEVSGSPIEAYVFRPCIVGGPDSPALVSNIPYVQARQALPAPLRGIFDAVPNATRILPDPGTPLQLVHADDVASALVAGVLGKGEPGVYNLAGDGEITFGDVANALGYTGVPVPHAAAAALSEVVGRLPITPARAEWLTVARVPVVMDTAKAKGALRWKPGHDSLSTLQDTVAGARKAGLLPT
jgi:nucleoside-diphosphate-sugar epimerase